MQGTETHLGDGQHALVIGDGANNNSNALGSLAVLQEAHNTLQGNWWTIGPAHEEAAKDDFVEFLVGTTVQESVELQNDNITSIKILFLQFKENYKYFLELPFC